MINLKFFLILCGVMLLPACSTTPPRNIENSCEIFREKDDWYEDAKNSYEKWGVPIQIQLAIIHQESSFRADAEAEMEYFLWVIPIGRKSSAYGYPQAQDATWEWYMKSTKNWGADRDDFDDAVDFIGWYGKQTYDMLKISKWDAKNQYLAYHEGHGGYKRKSYNGKPWLLKVANKVDKRAKKYGAQLKTCKDELNSSGWFW